MFSFGYLNQGVGNTLKRHYETYLLEYELAHDDVDGECCLLCHRFIPFFISLFLFKLYSVCQINVLLTMECAICYQ